MMRAAAAALALGLLLVAAGCGSSNAATGSSSGIDAASSFRRARLPTSARTRSSTRGPGRSSRMLFGPIGERRHYKNDLARARRPREPCGAGRRGRQARSHCDRQADGRREAAGARQEVRPGDRALHRREHRRLVGRRGLRVGVPVRTRCRDGKSLADNAGFKNAMSQVQRRFRDRLRVGGRTRAVAREAACARRGRGLAAVGRGGHHCRQERPARRRARCRRVDAGGVQAGAARDVPSGAILAVSFKDGISCWRGQGRPTMASLRRSSPTCVGSAAKASSTSLPGAMLPVITLEVQARRSGRGGEVAPRVGCAGRQAAATPRRTAREQGAADERRAGLNPGGGSLVEDQPFKDAFAAADVPDKVQWLAYADVQRLAPIVQALSRRYWRRARRSTAAPSSSELGHWSPSAPPVPGR